MPDNVTTMKDLITKIHKVFVDNRSKIRLLKTFKNGVLPPTPAFPAMAILPQKESFSYLYTGGKYRVNRELELQVVTKTMNKRDGRDQVEDLMDGCIRIIRDNHEFEGECYDTFADLHDMEDPIEREDSIVDVGIIKLNCFSFEFKPDRRLRTTKLYEAKSNHLLSQIYDLFWTYKNDVDYPLRNLKGLEVQSLGPRIQFPLALVSEMSVDRDRTFTGIDIATREIRIEIFTKLLDKDFALYSNLDLVENIKKILQLDSTLGGAVLDSEIDNISYLRSRSDVLGLIYNSIITFGCQAQEYLREEEVMNEKDKKSW
jgi:hypothetical protein